MRKPDFVIGDPAAPYLRRWWIIPRNRFFNIYLHQVLRDDDERALHDHPWWNVSIILKGGYWEVVPRSDIGPEWHQKKWRAPGRIVFRRATAAHRLELKKYGVSEIEALSAEHRPAALMNCLIYGDREYAAPVPCWSLFITGPKVREWGFHCASGWKHWRDFCGVPAGQEAKGDERGPGCGEA